MARVLERPAVKGVQFSALPGSLCIKIDSSSAEFIRL